MCLVLFAWLSNQEYFKELTDIDIRKNLFSKNEQAIEDDVLPFGFINDGAGGSVQENDEFGTDSLLTHAEWDIDDTQGIF